MIILILSFLALFNRSSNIKFHAKCVHLARFICLTHLALLHCTYSLPFLPFWTISFSLTLFTENWSEIGAAPVGPRRVTASGPRALKFEVRTPQFEFSCSRRAHSCCLLTGNFHVSCCLTHPTPLYQFSWKAPVPVGLTKSRNNKPRKSSVSKPTPS